MKREVSQMKIAVSATGEGLDSQVDVRFGRCSYFIIVDVDGKEIKNFHAIQNEGALQGGGAGPVAAQQIGNLNVDKLITGNLGPNAYAVISQLGIEAYQASGTVEEVIRQLLDGKLSKITETVQPHFGMGRGMGPSGGLG
jgi:predicted Fe-Mo cluster-binding NifX family protein